MARVYAPSVDSISTLTGEFLMNKVYRLYDTETKEYCGKRPFYTSAGRAKASGDAVWGKFKDQDRVVVHEFDLTLVGVTA